METTSTPTAIVEPGVKMGRDNYVGTGCVIKAGTIIEMATGLRRLSWWVFGC